MGSKPLLEGWQQRLKYQYLTKSAEKLNWFMHKIVQKVEKHNIPHSLIINADQAPSKYVPVGRSTLAEKNEKDVPISGIVDKRSITATFAETLDGSFLPFQLIYKGKTTQSLPKIDFPDGFSLSVNEKHLAILRSQSSF